MPLITCDHREEQVRIRKNNDDDNNYNYHHYHNYQHHYWKVKGEGKFKSHHLTGSDIMLITKTSKKLKLLESEIFIYLTIPTVGVRYINSAFPFPNRLK